MNPSLENTIVLLVTYANRFNLVHKVLQQLLNQGVKCIWIADNSSTEESATQLKNIANLHSEIKCFHFRENIGTSGAYNVMLKKLYQENQVGFAWFLDDDNLPLENALQQLYNSYASLMLQEKKEPVLYSYRGKSWPDDLKAVTTGWVKQPLVNSFCAFSLLAKLKSFFVSTKTNGLNQKEVNYPIVRVKYGPYGGLFTSISNLKNIGLPAADFFVYADDHEFTYRFDQKNIPQFLIYQSQIEDIDQTIVEDGGYFSPKTPEFKLYYGIRNTTYFYHKIKQKPIIYAINKFGFLSFLFLLALKNYPKHGKLAFTRLSLFIKAFSQGEKGVLGKTYKV